jgi:thioredoxin 1
VFDSPITTGDQSIDRVLAAGLPVLLVFIPPAPPPALEQAMTELARSLAGKLLVVKVPARDNPETVRRYQVGSQPAVVGLRDGQVLSQAEQIGAQELKQHALYLAGQGPQPQPGAAQSSRPGDGAQGGGQGQARPSGSAPSRPVNVTDAAFDRQVLGAASPVLVDFWAPWCGPCRMTEPILEKLAGEMAGRLLVAKVNVDENPAVAQRYAIQSIPTMMVVRDGKIVDRWMGALPEPALRSRLSKALA